MYSASDFSPGSVLVCDSVCIRGVYVVLQCSWPQFEVAVMRVVIFSGAKSPADCVQLVFQSIILPN